MPLFGSSFESDEDKNLRKYKKEYRRITGCDVYAENLHDLKALIEINMDGPLSSMKEVKDLNNLHSKLDNNG